MVRFCVQQRCMSQLQINDCSKKIQNYVLKLPKRYIYALCKLKCANHRMPSVTGRWANIPVDDRTCTLCQSNDTGDESHYLFTCTFFSAQHIKYIKNYYYTQPNTYKTIQLFESPDYNEMLNLAKFAEIIVRQFRPNKN
ncbi:unnamed protein product [Meganyctiphanes norvegica]|uniref:Reverse transcriptase zinc-binding domain-containing protein n=1 Tax=Meganyctiphanes norvegica TaxID=48144 RepID=A0AAV2SGL5_MEGNR